MENGASTQEKPSVLVSLAKLIGGAILLIPAYWFFSGVSEGVRHSPAVDGYKAYKFGMSFTQLSALKPCTLGHAEHSKDLPKVTSYDCPDFNFDGKRTNASFLFINDELLRVVLLAGTTSAESYALIEPLSRKYGSPTSYDKDQANAFDNGKIEKFEAEWAGDSVILSLQHVSGHLLGLLIYSSDVYQTRAFGPGSRSVANDI